MRGTTVTVLGSIAAEVDGRPADLGGARQRALLGALAAAGGRPVSTARLHQELWGDDDGPGSAKTLSVYVSRLRKALGDVVQLQAGGYCLDPCVVVDADLARRALDEARATPPAEALRLLDAALARWRGEPYAGLTGPVAVREQSRLEDLRVSLVERRAEALLELGEHHEVVLALHAEPRVGDVDRLSVLLAIALHRSGRPVEALEVARARRDLLLDSGLDPSPELVALERDLLQRAEHLEPVVPAQRTASPPPARRGSTPPVPLSSYVGRAGDLAAARHALASARLVTLVGTGGVGKTRTALELLGNATAVPVAWLALAEQHDPALLPAAAASALGVTPTGGTPPLEAVASALGGGAALLVVDNCEHLVTDVADLVARLLTGCAGLRVLATSRERLGIAGEVAVELAPLPVTDESGDDGPAVALFLARAGGWTPDSRDLQAIREVCAALDGLPLAIELAAARCPVLSPEDIAAELQDRFSLLTSRAGLLRHHRSLHAAIDWSYRLLSRAEQQCLSTLAVFEGGFELDAATRVLAAPAAVAVAELVARSLLEVDLSVRPRRYRMLESVRDFAWQQADGADRTEAQRRHVTWTAEVVQEAAAGVIDGPRGPACIARLDAERANVRAAVRAAVELGEVATALRMTGDLGDFWYRRGLVEEGLSLLELALSAAEPDDAATAWPLQARVHLQQLRGEDDAALVTAQCAHALVDRVVDPHVVARVEATLSWAATGAGDVELGRRHAERAADLAAGTGSDALLSEALLCRAVAATASGDPHAGRLALEATERARTARHDWAAGTAIWIAASCALRAGEHRLAAARGCEAVEHGERGSDNVLVLRGVLVLAGALPHLGEAAAGARLLGALSTTCARTGLRVEGHPGEVEDVLAGLRATLGHERAARAHAEGATWDAVQMVAAVRSIASRLRLRDEPCACAGGRPDVLLLMPMVRTAGATGT